MNKRGTGAIFCLISAILYVSNKFILFISASILGANGEMHTNKMEQLISYIKEPISSHIIILALLIGIIFIIWEELVDFLKK